MYREVIINVDELWLKGNNRAWYYKLMKQHLMEVIDKHIGLSTSKLTHENHRYLLHSGIDLTEAQMLAFTKIPGIHSIAPARRVELSLEAIIAGAISELEQMNLPKTFKVFTSRPNKNFKENSMEICKQVGHALLVKFPSLKVDIHHPELVVHVRVLDEGAYVSVRKIMGIGGLPFDCNGHLVSMLSGGFDSAVASYLMAKRGCRITFAFFHAYPYVGDEVKDKIYQLTSKLMPYLKFARLYIIPFGQIQKSISDLCRDDYRTLLFRAYMMRTSQYLAKRVKAQGILTGDSLGQVSSQTMHNIVAMERNSRAPILRPLIGFNKYEIMAIAKTIETHDISLIPHDDACALFAPKHPVLRPNPEYFDQFLSEHIFQQEMKLALDSAEVWHFDCLGQRFPHAKW
jgi:thiamine biosynthesis protein ThiI